MPQFTFTVRDQDGKASSGTIEAPDRNAAMKQLTERNLIVTKVAPVKVISTGAGLTIKTEQLLSFTQSLAAMLDSGLTLKQSLNTLGRDTSSKAMSQILRELEEKLSEGHMYSTLLQSYPRVFSRLYVSMIEAGEASGKLPEIMARLGTYIEETEELTSKVRTAFYYPAIVIGFAVLLVTFLFIFAVPRLTEIYSGMNAQLPFATRLFMGFGNALANDWTIWVPCVVLLALALWQGARTDPGRRIVDGAKLTLPLIGPLYQKLSIARFARTASSLFASGINVIDALRIVARSLDNEVLEGMVMSAADGIGSGHALASELRKTGIFTEIAISMIAAGEEAGAIDHMLDRLAQFYETQVSIHLKALVGLIEPLLMVGVGGIIGIIVLVIALPFMQIATVIH